MKVSVKQQLKKYRIIKIIHRFVYYTLIYCLLQYTFFYLAKEREALSLNFRMINFECSNVMAFPLIRVTFTERRIK